MSLMGTLAKVAIGVAVAKGVGGMMKGAAGQAQPRTGNAGNGGLFGGAHSPSGGQSRTGLEDMMGDLLGGGSRGAQGGAVAVRGVLAIFWAVLLPVLVKRRMDHSVIS